MKEAFTYMLKDNKIVQKALTYFGLILISGLCTNFSQFLTPKHACNISISCLVLGLIGIFLSMITSGYGISCKRAIVEQKENIVLPFLKFGSNLFSGFKFGVAITLLVLAITAVIMISAIIGKLLSPVIPVIVIALLCLFIVCYAIAFTYIFVTTDSWLSFFKIKQATKIIASWQYWKNVLVMMGLSVISAVISSLVSFIFKGAADVIINTTVMSIIGSYFVFVFSYLVANCAKQEA